MKIYTQSKRYKEIISYPTGLSNLGLILRKAQEIKERKLIDCTLGETIFSLPLSIKKRGIKVIQEDDNQYVKPFFGLKILRGGLEKAFKKEGLIISSENIVVTAGSELGMDLFFRSILNCKDEVLLVDPFFPPFVINILAYGGKPVLVDTYKTKFIPDPQLIRKKITKKTKIIVINSPNNPTGAVYPTKVLKEIVKIARRHGLIILSDEVYADFIYEGKFISLLKLYPEGSVILRSFSKTYSMMGYKVGWLTGTPTLINRIKEIYIPMYSGPRISELMAEEAIKHQLPSKIITGFKKKRDYIYNNTKMVCPDLIKPNGAFYFYLKAPKGNALAFSESLLKNKVLVSPAFSRKNSHFRISYAGLEGKILKQFMSILKETYLVYTKEDRNE